MITRIEIDGFKSFREFSLDLKPFQVIIGPNSSGKSNLFSAIRLLSLLAQHDVKEAFRILTQECGELFTKLSNGETRNEMRLAVEVLIDPTLIVSLPATGDENSQQTPLPDRRLSYEVSIRQIVQNDRIDFDLISEKLVSLDSGQDYIGSAEKNWVPLKKGILWILSRSAPDQPSPFALDAMRAELQNWRLFHFSPKALRESSSWLDKEQLEADGANLPNVLARMAGTDDFALKDVARALASIVPEIASVEIDREERRKLNHIVFNTYDGRRFSADEMSDGTLRLLALAVMRNDPESRGVVCLEEPENGVHPAAQKRLVRLLRDMSTDSADVDKGEQPLRQLLVASHSPHLISQLEIEKGELLFAERVTRVEPGVSATKITRIVPVPPGHARNTPEGAYAYNKTIEYLNESDLLEARTRLRQAFKK